MSLDFSVGLIPGWHATIFPPYFVAGAVYAGFANGADTGVAHSLLLRIARLYHGSPPEQYGQSDAGHRTHCGLMGYAMEQFFAWYSASPYEGYMMQNRTFGPYSGTYWSLILCNVAIPQLLWIKQVRLSPSGLFIISMFINVGMWLERFVIVVTSLHRDFMAFVLGYVSLDAVGLGIVRRHNWIFPLYDDPVYSGDARH